MQKNRKIFLNFLMEDCDAGYFLLCLRKRRGMSLKKKIFFLISLILMFVPMPFVWFGYGEKGYAGYTMLGNMIFWGGLFLLFLSVCLRIKTIRIFCRYAGSAILLCSYGWAAQDFCRHLPMEISPLEVCRFPMWISFIGAFGIIVYACFMIEDNKKAELE
ncbi:hypothetical protein [Anaerotignum sp.]